jgi:hypothetical protein
LKKGDTSCFVTTNFFHAALGEKIQKNLLDYTVQQVLGKVNSKSNCEGRRSLTGRKYEYGEHPGRILAEDGCLQPLSWKRPC